MKKFCFAVLCCVLLACACFAADYSVTRITSDCTVYENGRYDLSQKIELDIPRAVEELTLPIGQDVKGAKVDSVSLTELRWDVYKQGGSSFARLKFYEPFTGKLTVNVSCSSKGGLLEDPSARVFSCTLLSGLWETEIERFAFSVVAPESVMTGKAPEFSSGYLGADVADTMVTASQGQAISGQVRGGLLDRESFSILLSDEEGIFGSGKNKSGGGNAVTWIFGILELLVLAAAVYYWFRYLRAPRLRVQARTTPPEGLSPGELAHLLCGSKPSFPLMVLHWASLGYLTVSVGSGGRILFRKSMDMGAERREEEQKLFDLLFADSDLCEGKSNRFSRTAEKAEKVMTRYWAKRLYEKGSGSGMILRAAATAMSAFAMLISMNLLLPPSGIKWLLLIISTVAGGVLGSAVWYGMKSIIIRDWKWIGAAALGALIFLLLGRNGGFLYILLALGADVLTGFLTRHMGKRTASGTDAVERAMGYARFLHHAEGQHLSQMLRRDGEFFYTALLYASACGAGRRLAQSLGGEEPEDCPWLQFAEKTPAQPYAYYLQFESLLKNLGKERFF